MPTLATNKKALHNYQILDKYEAGIVLTGAEVKAVKGGHLNLQGSYVTAHDHQFWLINCHVSPYQAAYQPNYEPIHERKLLLRAEEIAHLLGKLATKGLTIAPLSVYTKGSLIKVEIGVCRGKKLFDKRATIKKRESDRRLQRLVRQKN